MTARTARTPLAGWMVCSVLACLLFACQALAVDGKVRLSGEHLFSSRFDAGSGKVAVSRAGVDVGLSKFTLGWQTSWYSWQDTSGLPFGNGRDNPWDALHMLSLRVDHRDSLAGKWSYFVQGSLRTGFEDQVSRSAGAAVGGGLVYELNDAWSLGIGGYAGWDPTGVSAMLGPSIQYRHPRSPGFSARLAMPRSEIRYTFDPTWSVWLSLGLDSGTYRLADDSPVMPRGYLRERRINSGLFLDCSPAPNITLRFGPTYNFQRRMEIHNSSGDKLQTQDLKPTPGLEAWLEWKF